MTNTEGGIERGLHQETLKKVSKLSRQKEQTGSQFKVTAKAVSPFVDEIKIKYPNGVEGVDYIEEVSQDESPSS